MEESLKRLEVEEPAKHAELYSGLTLAYIGDAVYELYIRGMLALRGNVPAGKLSFSVGTAIYSISMPSDRALA